MFQQTSRDKLKQLMEQPLVELKLCAIVIDGTPFQGRQMIAAIGVAQDGKKAVLGLRPFRFGTAAPTTSDLRTFPVLNEDFAVTKETRIAERLRLETYGQFFNIFNRHRFHTFDGNFSSGSFGRPSGVSLPRFIQLGLRVRF